MVELLVDPHGRHVALLLVRLGREDLDDVDGSGNNLETGKGGFDRKYSVFRFSLMHREDSAHIAQIKGSISYLQPGEVCPLNTVGSTGDVHTGDIALHGHNCFLLGREYVYRRDRTIDNGY